MKIINPQVIIENDINQTVIIKKLEKYGKVCYKSEDNITNDSAEKFIKNILKNGHESIIEHQSITVRIICDRGVTHEIVRHRLASYSQESTRYCNYSLGKFEKQLTFIKPCYWNESEEEYTVWLEAMQDIEKVYIKLIDMGAKPEEARSVLPNSLKTEIIVTMNLREWRHFFKLRTSIKAHPQMREVANMILNEFKVKLPIIFSDI